LARSIASLIPTAKRAALAEWVQCVNALKEYGEWASDISYNVADVDGIIAKHTI
jgi:type III restriction enzyme